MKDLTSKKWIGSDAHRSTYIERVNAVIDHVEQHLDGDLRLEALTDVALFSPFHFHRIFSNLVGETPSQFVARVRIERAATRLLQRPHQAISIVAEDCGFASASSFSRVFRETFAMSATEWRSGGYRTHERAPGAMHCDPIRDLGMVKEGYGILDLQFDPSVWTIACGSLGTATVTVKHLPTLEVAYVRHTGQYQGMGEIFNGLFGRLVKWAEPLGLMTPDSQVLVVAHDNPSITEDDKLRVSACLSVPEGTTGSGGVGRMKLDGGNYAVGHFELGEADYSEAWYAFVGGWLPDSGYEPDDGYSYERYCSGEQVDAAAKQVVDICLPVRPIRNR